MRTIRAVRADLRRIRAPFLVALLVSSWILASEIVLGEIFRTDVNTPLAFAGWVFVVGSAGVIVWRMAVTVTRSRLAAEEALAANEALRSMELITEAALSDLDLDDLLDELLSRIRAVLRADGACLFLLDDERDALVPRAAVGMEELVRDRVLVPVGFGVAGAIAASGKAAVVHDLGAASVYTPLLKERYRSLIGAPLFAEGAVIGVVYVVSTEEASFTARNLGVLELMAERASAAIDRARLLDAERRSRLGADHARRHVTLLSQASEVLNRSLEEYKVSIAELGEIVVPAFADWFAIDLSGEDAPVRRLAAKHVALTAADAAMTHRAHPGADAYINAVMASGRSELTIDTVAAAADAPPGTRQRVFMEEALALGIASTMIVPIRVRGLSFGAMTFGTGADRRGYRPSDLVAAERLADRVTVAIERVLLYREVQETASSAEKLAGQLRRLMEASFTVNAPLSREEVVATVALQARRVIGAGRAVVVAPDADGTELAVASPAGGSAGPTDAERVLVNIVASTGVATKSDDRPGQALAVPLNTADGRPGAIVVTDKHERGAEPEGFSDDDEYLLVSLAQMASIAIRNSDLYESAQAREEHLQALVDAAPLGILELDVGGGLRRWNTTATEMFGWDRDDPSPTLPEEVSDLLAGALASTVAGSAVVDAEATLESGRHAVVRTAAVRDNTGAIDGVLAVFADISERRLLEEQLRQSQRMEAIGRLAGGVAHDFNNLLTVIIGYSDLVLRTVSDERSRRDLQAVKDAGEKAARLTSQLLAISRHQVLQPVIVDPNEIVRSMNEVLARLIEEDVAITTSIDESVGPVLVDRGHLEQVILNLVVNARDAMPGGGRLALETSSLHLTGPSAAFPDAAPGSYVSLTVRDTGTGMDAATLAHCFDPFFTTKTRDKGNGLGLATVYGIIRQSGGHISATSAPGVGTTMQLLLPSATSPAGDSSPRTGPHLLAGSERVLLVEDEAPVRQLARIALEESGYTVMVAANGLDALDLANEFEGPIDLLLTDVVMPEMGGPELARRLLQTRPDLRILFMSGYSEVQGGPAELSTDAAFLPKPFRPDDLVARVRAVLDEPARTG